MLYGYKGYFGNLKQMPSAILIGFILAGVIWIAGCDSSDTQRTDLNVRISDPDSVFALFADTGDQGFVYSEGLFGPTGGSTGETTLTITEVMVAGTNSTARFRTDPNPDDPSANDEVRGEGDADAEASCNYTYDNNGPRIECPLCHILIFGLNLPCGSSSTAQLFLHLDVEDSDATRTNPALQSNSLSVTVNLDANCNLVSVNNVAVMSEPNTEFMF